MEPLEFSNERMDYWYNRNSIILSSNFIVSGNSRQIMCEIRIIFVHNNYTKSRTISEKYHKAETHMLTPSGRISKPEFSFYLHIWSKNEGLMYLSSYVTYNYKLYHA